MFKLVAFSAMLLALQLVSGVRWGEECWYESPGYKFPDSAVELVPGVTTVDACKKHCLDSPCFVFHVIDGNKCYMLKAGAYVNWDDLLTNQPNAVHYQNCRELAPENK